MLSQLYEWSFLSIIIILTACGALLWKVGPVFFYVRDAIFSCARYLEVVCESDLIKRRSAIGIILFNYYFPV